MRSIQLDSNADRPEKVLDIELDCTRAVGLTSYLDSIEHLLKYFACIRRF